jgi:hypothetical protein
MMFAVRLAILAGTYAISWTLSYISVMRSDFSDFFPYLRRAWTTALDGAPGIMQIMAVVITLTVAWVMWYVPRVRKDIANHAPRA